MIKYINILRFLLKSKGRQTFKFRVKFIAYGVTRDWAYRQEVLPEEARCIFCQEAKCGPAGGTAEEAVWMRRFHIYTQ